MQSNNNTITFIITDRTDSGFVNSIYAADNIMKYGNGILLHEPEYLLNILKYVVDDFRYRIIIHYGLDSGRNGLKYLTSLQEAFGGNLSVAMVSRNEEFFKDGETKAEHKNMTIYNTDFINTKAFVDSLVVYDKTMQKVESTAVQLVRQVLTEFSNSVRKITSNRRKNHPNFEIRDEYDVQDILYVMLKSVFPNLKEEDPIPKVGGTYSKVDFIIREHNILIEVKMIKESDQNETKFAKELKEDLESYYECQWLKKLFCFVYDPYKKTRDRNSLEGFTGLRTIKGHEYHTEVILVE